MARNQLKVLLADDHAVVQAGYKSMLEGTPDIMVTGTASSGEEAYNQFFKLQPDVVVMDLSMPGIGGFEAARRILARDNKARILVLTMHQNEVLLKRVLDIGVRGYMTKSNDAEIIIQAVRQIAGGHLFVGQEMTEHLVNLTQVKTQTIFDDLSPREFETFMLTAAGQTINEIAEALQLSPKTVGHHLTQIRKKLGVNSGADMARLAIRHGLMEA